MTKRHLFTSESVTEGHPDKLCDQISDAVLDEVFRQDTNGRVACETYITAGLVIVGGEITTTGYADIHELVRNVIKEIGYVHPKYGFSYDTCAILNAIRSQSPDIAQGVVRGGAGDQGLMVGYANRETPTLMPLPITLAHALTKRLTQVRKEGILGYLGPDGKSQVTVEYRDDRPHRVDAVVISAQHTEEILDETGTKITETARNEIIRAVIETAIGSELLDDETRYFINPTGKFVIGGPQSDTGMTGRKIIVDTYGGMAPHGGGAFSGKDPTKVDRSASYMARYIAKNIVGAGLADQCLVQLAYAIGVPEPVSILIEANGNVKVPNHRLTEMVKECFLLSPQGIIEKLDLLRPIYKMTASYGHFGREEPEFSWERLDMVDELRRRT